MRNLLSILALLLILIEISAVKCNAEEIPKYLKDGIITVTLKDGTKHVFSTNEYKVVKRGSDKIVVEESEVTEREKHLPLIIIMNDTQPKRHIFSLMSGASRTSLNPSLSGTSASVTNKYELDAGGMYQYQLVDRFYLNILGTVNGTGMIGFGLGL